MSYKYPYFDNASKVGSPYMKDYSHASNTFVSGFMPDLSPILWNPMIG